MTTFSVDFDIKVSQTFTTIHSALIPAQSVSECQDKAEQIRDTLPQNKNHHVHIFIEEPS